MRCSILAVEFFQNVQRCWNYDDYERRNRALDLFYIQFMLFRVWNTEEMIICSKQQRISNYGPNKITVWVSKAGKINDTPKRKRNWCQRKLADRFDCFMFSVWLIRVFRLLLLACRFLFRLLICCIMRSKSVLKNIICMPPSQRSGKKKMYRQLFFRSDRRLWNWNLTKEKSHGFPAFGSVTRHYALNASLRLCSEIAKLVSCYNQFPVFKKRTIMTNFNFEMRFSHDNIVQLR